MNENEKPFIILSAAMTIDGKIATKDGDSDLSDKEDWKEVHKLRSEVDAILVGKGTIMKDNPKLHIKYQDHNGYYRIIIDSNLEIPILSNVIEFEPKLYPTIICTTENASKNRSKLFESKGVKILKSGIGPTVDVVNLMPKLWNIGIKSILLEGGATLNWTFIKYDLVDEIRLTISPWIVGGRNAISLVQGDGFSKMIESTKYALVMVKNRDNYVVMHYEKLRR